MTFPDVFLELLGSLDWVCVRGSQYDEQVAKGVVEKVVLVFKIFWKFAAIKLVGLPSLRSFEVESRCFGRFLTCFLFDGAGKGEVVILRCRERQKMPEKAVNESLNEGELNEISSGAGVLLCQSVGA